MPYNEYSSSFDFSWDPSNSLVFLFFVTFSQMTRSGIEPVTSLSAACSLYLSLLCLSDVNSWASVVEINSCVAACGRRRWWKEKLSERTLLSICYPWFQQFIVLRSSSSRKYNYKHCIRASIISPLISLSPAIWYITVPMESILNKFCALYHFTDFEQAPLGLSMNFDYWKHRPCSEKQPNF